MNNINNFDENKHNNNKKLRNKSSKNIIKNKNKYIPIKNRIKNIGGCTPNKYITNQKTNNINNSKFLNDNDNENIFINQLNDNYYNLEEEREFLLQMAAKKNLQQFSNLNNNDLSDESNLKKDKDYDKTNVNNQNDGKKITADVLIKAIPKIDDDTMLTLLKFMNVNKI